jgi:3-hydroxyisobutyrate dehydrogenase-like beta-hydroxyacid dehydrogenase
MKKATNGAPHVGVVGLGIMGSAMAANMLKAGYRVTGFDVVPAARAALAKDGGRVAKSAADVARAAPIVITSLPTSAAVEAVAQEIAKTRRKGLIVVETSTMPLATKDAARAILEQAGITLMDCPLSGTGAQARVKDLLVYASGPKAAFDECAKVFPGFSKGHYYLGAFGNGSKMKYIANHLVAIHNVAAGEAMTLASKAGLDLQQVLDVVAGGAGGSRMFQVRGPMMVANDYADATMKVEVWQKDMHIIGEFATDLDCPVPLFATSAPIYTAAMASGHAKDDTASVCAVLEAMAGVRRAPAKMRAKRAARRRS